MYPQEITSIVAPLLDKYPDYELRPVTYLFGNSKVEVDGPAEGAAALHQGMVNALREGGFEAYPVSTSDCAIALNVRARTM
jgi:hypothetical protein